MTNEQYLVAMFKWLLGYFALLAISITLLLRGVAGLWLVPTTLLPMLPAFGILFAVMQRYRGMDELEQRILNESIIFAFGSTAIITLSYGFLENSAHAPILSYLWVWPIMAALWIGGTVNANKRYK